MEKLEPNTALKFASIHGRLDIIKFLECGEVTRDEALILASEYGHLEVVKYLVEQGANVRVKDNRPLLCAVRNGHLEMVKYLVSNTRVDDWALRLASFEGHLEIVKYLVSLGGDIRSHNDYALRWASRGGYLELVKYLVSVGADVRAENDYSLIFAGENRHFEVVRFLLSKGADRKNIYNKEEYEAYENKIKLEAQKKLYYWWIQICYDPNRAVGRRMMERSWERYNEMVSVN